MNRRLILIVLGAIVVLTGVLIYQFSFARGQSGADWSGNLFSRLGFGTAHDGGKVIRVSGNIEVVDAEVSFKIPGRVRERRVDEGEKVKAGDVIAVLESADLEAEVAARQAELQAAQAAWQEVQNGSRKEEIESARATMEKAANFYQELQHGSRPEEIETARAALESAEVAKARTAEEWERTRTLERQAISAEEYRKREAAYLMASANWREAQEHYKLVTLGPRKEQKDQAKAALDQATWQFELVKAGPRKEVHDQASAKLAQAQASLKLAETRLSYATIVSPLTGVVLSKNIEPGEYVSPGTPVVTVGDLAHPWLRAYIDEVDLDRVKYDQSARVITSRSADKVYNARVGFIASEAEFTPKIVQTEKERTKLVYRIKIYAENDDMGLKRGMPADAEILLDSTPSSAAGH